MSSLPKRFFIIIKAFLRSINFVIYDDNLSEALKSKNKYQSILM